MYKMKKNLKGNFKRVTCGLFIFDKKSNELLIAHPTGATPNRWDIPKGGYDETIDADLLSAAIRECWEETNFDCDLHINKEDYIELEGLIPHKNKSLKKAFKYFFVFVDRDEVFKDHEFKCNSFVQLEGKEDFPEMDDWKWVDIDLCFNLLSINQIEALIKFKKVFNNIKLINSL